jgi:hypothetical protein
MRSTASGVCGSATSNRARMRDKGNWRLGKSCSRTGLWDIVKLLEAIDDGGCGLRILNLGGEVIDTRSATGRLILTMFAC